MGEGEYFLLTLCIMEARVQHLWLTLDRKPGHQFKYGNSKAFIRGLMGAMALDKAKAMGLI